MCMKHGHKDVHMAVESQLTLFIGVTTDINKMNKQNPQKCIDRGAGIVSPEIYYYCIYKLFSETKY